MMCTGFFYNFGGGRFITNYLGELDWAVHKGVSAVEIVRAGPIYISLSLYILY